MRSGSWALVLLLTIGSPAALDAVKSKKPSQTKSSRSKTKSKKRVAKKPVRRAYLAPVAPKVRKVAYAQVTTRLDQATSVLANAGALVPFFERMFSGHDETPVHILHFGDSHTASDDWPDSMRQQLQSKFGVGGPGFVMPGRPYRGYRRYDAGASSSSGWRTEGTVGREGDGVNGLGGVSLSTTASGETVALVAECEQIQLLFLKQPGGGSLTFFSDGVPRETISTDGELGPGYYQYSAGPGQHRFEVQTLGGPIRLFGWIAENHSGLTYETMGINGARASMLVNWNDAIWADHIAHRSPALVIVAYGTNEAMSPRWNSDEYRAVFRQVIEKIRNASPQTSILVIGPPDCAYRSRRQRLAYPHLDEVIAIQREVSTDLGAAFWDWRARMGGPGSVRQWVAAGLSQADHVHLTTAGYRALGAAILDDLLQQYNRFTAVRAE